MSKKFISDLDGVLLNTTETYAKKWTEILGITVLPKHFTNWKMELALGVDPDYTDKFWHEVWSESFDPYPAAARFLREIKSLGYEIVILTTRGSPESKASLRREIVKLPTECISNIITCDNNEAKSKHINNIPDAEFFLDDHVKNAVDAQIHCTHLKKVFLFDRPWNRSTDLCGYSRIYSYYEVVAALHNKLH